MIMEPIIELSNVTMRFAVTKMKYGFKSIFLQLPQYIKERSSREYFFALDDVSFSIKPGEHVGLIGHNGCGKTTLLSVIGGVYRRYQGTVKVRGRISMLLSLGAGFCPQLSGRENIELNGVFQGKTRREMAVLMDDIIDFAGLGKFIDAPLFQYSSGMISRLGFSIATAIEPEILLVDEVMAVGDADFKQKCRTRMNKLFDKGTTLILVSHQMNDIKHYCDRVIELKAGKVIRDGATADVLSAREKESAK